MSQAPNQDEILTVVINEEGQTESSPKTQPPSNEESVLQPLNAEQQALLDHCRKLNDNHQCFEVISLLEKFDYKTLHPELCLELCSAYSSTSRPGQKEHLLHNISNLQAIQRFFQQTFRWNFMMGYAYFCLEQEWKALPFFEQAHNINPKDIDVSLYIKSSLSVLATPNFLVPFSVRVAKMWDTFMEKEAVWRARLESEQNKAPILVEIQNVVNLAFSPASIDVKLKPDPQQPRFQLIFEVGNSTTVLFALQYMRNHAPFQPNDFWEVCVGQNQYTDTTCKYPHAPIDLSQVRFKLLNAHHTRDFNPFEEVKGLQPTPCEHDDHIAFGEEDDISTPNHPDHEKSLAPSAAQTPSSATNQTPSSSSAQSHGQAQTKVQTKANGQGSTTNQAASAAQTAISTNRDDLGYATPSSSLDASPSAASNLNAPHHADQAHASETSNDATNATNAANAAGNEATQANAVAPNAEGNEDQVVIAPLDESSSNQSTADHNLAQTQDNAQAQANNQTAAQDNTQDQTSAQYTIPNGKYELLNYLPHQIPLDKSRQQVSVVPKFTLGVYYPPLANLLIENDNQPNPECSKNIKKMVQDVFKQLNLSLGESTMLAACTCYRFMGYKTRFERLQGPNLNLNGLVDALEKVGYKRNLDATDLIKDYARVDYQFDKPLEEPNLLRADIFKGYSLATNLNNDYYLKRANEINMLQCNGLCAGFIAYDHVNPEPGTNPSIKRQNLQNSLISFIDMYQCTVIGAAYGLYRDYIDFISYANVREVLKDIQNLFRCMRCSHVVWFSPFRITPCAKLFYDGTPPVFQTKAQQSNPNQEAGQSQSSASNAATSSSPPAQGASDKASSNAKASYQGTSSATSNGSEITPNSDANQENHASSNVDIIEPVLLPPNQEQMESTKTTKQEQSQAHHQHSDTNASHLSVNPAIEDTQQALLQLASISKLSTAAVKSGQQTQLTSTVADHAVSPRAKQTKIATTAHKKAKSKTKP